MLDKYIEGVYPQSVYDAIQNLKRITQQSTQKEWLSNERSIDDDTEEVLRYTFGKPASISAISFDIRKIGCKFSIWYKNRQGVMLPMLQSNRQAIAYTVIADEDISWGQYKYEVYPIVASEIEIRLQRYKTALSPVNECSLGLRGVLIKRSITTRQDAAVPLPDMTDSLGNNVTNVVSDWGADKAFDDDTNTYWKSEPQPSPDAVVSLYVDTRDDFGEGQWIDHFFIDPVNAGQNLNVYYSNDDTEGDNLLSESALIPKTQTDTIYEYDKGLQLKNISSEIIFENAKVDLNSKRSHWAGFQWTPLFSSEIDRKAYLLEHGEMSIYYDNNQLHVVNGTNDTHVNVEEFDGSGNKTFNIVAGLNLASDSDLSGTYIGYCINGTSTIHKTDTRAKVLISETSDKRALLNGVVVNADDYFLIENDSFSVKKEKLTEGDTLELEFFTDVFEAEELKLSFYSVSDAKYGGIVNSKPAQLPALIAKGLSGEELSRLSISHSAKELCPNPVLDIDAANIGYMVEGIAPIGNAALISKDISWFDMYPYKNAKQNEAFICTYTAKSVTGISMIEPVISSDKGDVDLSSYEISRINTIDSLYDGWIKYSCVLTAKEDLNDCYLGFKAVPTDDMSTNNEARSYISSISFAKSSQQAKQYSSKELNANSHSISFEETQEDSFLASVSLSNINSYSAGFASDTTVASIAIEYTLSPGSFTISKPRLTSFGSDASYASSRQDDIRIGDLGGYLRLLVLKQEPLTDNTVASFMQSPEVYALPEPSLDNVYTSLSNALLVGRLSYEEVFRGGADSTKFTSKSWLPIYSDWTVQRKWYYLPQTTLMKYLKLEISNLTMQPYPIWEDGIKTTYQVFPVSVTQVSKKLATLDTTKTTTTTTTGTTTNTTDVTNGQWTSTNSMHDSEVSQTSGDSTKYSETDLPRDYEIDVQKPYTSNFPGSGRINYDQEFHSETTNSAIYKGSTSSTSTSTDRTVSTSHETYTRQVPRQVTKTWTETKVVAKVKTVSQDVYYKVQKGDCLITIARKLGIPDWKVIYAYNIWLQSDPRVSMLPKRSAGWWIFPGQNFRIPNAVMKQITVYETVKVQKTSTETVYDTVTEEYDTETTTDKTTTIDTTTDTEINRQDTTSTTRDRFRSESVHRYDVKTVNLTNSFAYFAAIRDIVIAKTNWLNERDVAMFDFADYISDGFSISGVSRSEEGVYRPDNTEATGQIISPQFKTVSEFRSIKILGVNKKSVMRQKIETLSCLEAYSPTETEDDAGSSLDETAWGDASKNWSDNTAPWGSKYEKSFNKLVKLDLQGAVNFSGGANSSDPDEEANTAIVAKSFSAKTGEIVSCRIKLTPNSALSNTAIVQLSIVDIDKTEVLSSTSFVESSMSAGQINTLSFSSVFCKKDYSNLAFVITVFGTSGIDYTITEVIRTSGSIRFLMRNALDAEWEDVSIAVGELDGIYTFKERGRSLELRIEMSDQNDWSTGLQIVPLYLADIPSI